MVNSQNGTYNLLLFIVLYFKAKFVFFIINDSINNQKPKVYYRK